MLKEKSLNLGAGTKPDFSPIFDDFPNCHGDLISIARDEGWQGLLDFVIRECGVTYDDILEVRLEGMDKYSRDNWKLSLGTEHHDEFYTQNKQSIYRHIAKYLQGEIRDSESKRGVKHLACVALRAMMAIEYDLHGQKAEGADYDSI